MSYSASRDPLRLSAEQLAKLDRDYPREGVHENIPEAHFQEWVKNFERFEKRKLSEDELKVARYFWRMRGEDDYIAIENALPQRGINPVAQAAAKALRAVLRVGNKEYFSRSEQNRHYRPFGYDKLNP